MKIKICGMKYKENIEQLAELKPDYMGFIFYSHSKRYVGDFFIMPEVPSEIKKTGVFVNSEEREILDKVKKYTLDFVQLHGDETPEFCESLSKKTKVIKAFGIDADFDFDSLNRYKKSCTYFLFDTKTSGYGGSGKAFDWNILKKYDHEVPFFLSGGIDEESIQELKKYKNLNIHALDINSKFEVEPGRKKIEKIKEFMSEVKSIAN